VPTYDYACDACGHRFEYFQSMTDDVLRACPSCRKRKLRRLIGAGAGIMFKGSGFYETDYKRPASRDKPSGDPGADESKRTAGDGEPATKRGKHESAGSAGSTERAADSPSKPPPGEPSAAPAKQDGQAQPDRARKQD
jgi:putative FmdB family regulatory protein